MAKNDVLFERVKYCLTAFKETRDSDNKLIYAVFRTYGMSPTATFASVVNAITEKRLPTFASVTRAKRKVVELHPELDCSSKVRDMRDEQELIYRQMSKIKEV